MLRRKREVFAPSDGVLSVMDETADRAVRGIDFSTTIGLAERMRLDFRSQRLRSEDYALAQADGAMVTRKVTCRRPPSAPTADTIVAIGGKTYEVTRADMTPKFVNLFLDELTTDGVATLTATETSTNALGEAERKTVTTDVWVRRARMGDKTAVKAGSQSPWPTLALTIRACDWCGERQVTYRGETYAVSSSKGDGAWVELTCEQGMVER